MTNVEMIDLLGLRLEDPDKKAFSSSSRYKALNVAQLTICNLIDNALLTELEHSEDLTAGATGKILISSLTYIPIRNGIYAVENNSSSVSAFLNLIEFKDIKRLENSYLQASTNNPIGYIFANTIYIKPASADACTIYYLRKPVDISEGQDSELDESLHEVVVDLAEAQLWRMDGQYDRANASVTMAQGIITALNTRLGLEKPQGVGTYGRISPASTTGA
tara:strand:- start:231 stop:890 length:660 start_codon:yes stop_codon:yes gene_type:complete